MIEINNILTKLQSRGHRLTKVRRLMLTWFVNSLAPLSFADLQKRFARENMAVNKTTVYRELDFLKHKHFIRELRLGKGARRYEILPEGEHHHIVCLNCQKVECVELKNNLGLEEKIMIKNNKFKVLNHALEFFGLCAKCQ